MLIMLAESRHRRCKLSRHPANAGQNVSRETFWYDWSAKPAKPSRENRSISHGDNLMNKLIRIEMENHARNFSRKFD